jgi:hypothetical protein
VSVILDVSGENPHGMVIAGLVPATPIIMARRWPVIGVAGTSPAMTTVGSLHRNML